MQGWDIDYDAIVVEEILDTNPDLYKRRALAAIEEERYYDAVQEAQTALKYSDGDIQYHFLIIKASYKMGMYGICYNYILYTYILEYVYETPWREFWTSAIDVDELMEIYMHCWRSTGHTLQDARVIVVYANDKGMVDTLQDAVNICLPSQYIYIMEETTNSGLAHCPFECAGCIIERGDVRITGRPVRMKIVVNGGIVRIKDMDIYPVENTVAIHINGGIVELEKVTIEGDGHNGKQIGIYVQNDSTFTLKNCLLINLDVGIYAEGGKVFISNSTLGELQRQNGNGIVAIGDIHKVVFSIEDSVFGCYPNAVVAGHNSDIKLYRINSRNNFGKISLDGGGYDDSNRGVIEIFDSAFNDIGVMSRGIINLYNTEVDEFEIDDSTVVCSGCKPRGRTNIRVRTRNGKIECDCKYIESNMTMSSTNVKNWVDRSRVILRWGYYPLVDLVRFEIEYYESNKEKLKPKMQCEADMLMKQLRESLVENDKEGVMNVRSKLLDIIVNRQ